MRYAVIIEKGESSYGAYVPELPGCVAVGETEAEALELIAGAIEMHLESMADDGSVPPEPKLHVQYVDVGGDGRLVRS